MGFLLYNSVRENSYNATQVLIPRVPFKGIFYASGYMKKMVVLLIYILYMSVWCPSDYLPLHTQHLNEVLRTSLCCSVRPSLRLHSSLSLAETAGKPSDARRTSSILSFMSQSPESSCLEVCLLQKKNYN